ncbi:MAG: YybH family protein [Candidatus Methylopumilus sp.]
MSIQSTLQTLNAQWDAAFNAKQAEQVAAMYDAAAAVIPAGAAQVSGQAEVLAFWNNAIAQGIMDHQLELIEAGESGDMAFQRGLWSAAVVNEQGERQTFSGNVHLLYRRQADGGWKVLSHIWN